MCREACGVSRQSPLAKVDCTISNYCTQNTIAAFIISWAFRRKKIEVLLQLQGTWEKNACGPQPEDLLPFQKLEFVVGSEFRPRRPGLASIAHPALQAFWCA